MRIKLLMFFLIIVAITGTAIADPPSEKLSASWTGSQIKAEAYDFKQTGSPPYWYQIRYYQPGTYVETNREIGEYSISNPNGYFIPNGPFLGYATFNSGNHYVEYFHPDIGGSWDIALMKAGISGSNPEYVSSFRKEFTITVSNPSISLKKTANPKSFTTVGQSITYTYEIKNTGTNLNGVFEVQDDHINSNQWFICYSGTLAADATVSCSQTYTITSDNINDEIVKNTANARIGSVNSNQEIVTIYYIGNGGGSPPGIPEFPTIALPVAAVIGLVFFLNNRKNKSK